MNYLISIVVLYLSSIMEVYSALQVISSSFQDNSFSDADDWVVSGGQAKFSDCDGKSLLGGFNGFSAKISVSKSFELPPHAQINLQVQFWKIDSWNSQNGYVFVDHQVAWQKNFAYDYGTKICGGKWPDFANNLNLNINHSGPTAVVVFTTDLNDPPDNESWGMRDFVLSVLRCPQGCLVCQLNDQLLTCQVWKMLSSSWIQQNKNQIDNDGWDVFSGISDSSQCGAVALFGGFNKTGVNSVISKSFDNIPPHYKLKLKILWAKIDSWDSEVAQIIVDGVLIWQKSYQQSTGYSGKICGDSSYPKNRTLFIRVEQDLDHTKNQVEIKFQTSLNEGMENESFGLRDFVLFYGVCTNNCAKCTGPSGPECLQCSQGYYNTGVDDKTCLSCYPSCYKCDGPTNEDCTDCGDPNVYNKILLVGQCVCTTSSIEEIQNDGTTLCLPCHPKCQKCYKPFDNTSNQYCTMCITGQNRTVSNELNCVCKAGYGDDGVSQICVQCHYTCENCNGSLKTDCTSCSSLSNRYLTTDNQCLCNQAYIDSGLNDVNCLYICHHSCSDCDSGGEDQCTSCPSTRQPDRIGTTFKCLCKDPHYFSDDIQLECLECHSTCKTCNGIYENNCLTCDLDFRQLVMSKCICPYGYYDIGQLQCSPCYYTCMTCFGPEEDNCITCSVSNNREVKANKCLCQDTYIEKQSGNPMCYSIEQNNKKNVHIVVRSAVKLQTIVHNVLVFLTEFLEQIILAPVLLNHMMNLKSYLHLYLIRLNIVCHNTCLTCNGASQNQCTSCNFQIMRQLDSSGQCLCIDKYFDAGQTECQLCSPYCLNCINSASNCTSCKSDRYLQGNTCLCLNKLNGVSISSYQIQGKIECLNCHYTCLSCNGSTATKCLTCLDTEMRILQNTSCVCALHYYDNGKPKCQQCSYKCEICAGADTICLSCYQNSFRILANQLCLCQKGYYDDGSNPVCQKCHHSCSQCSSISTKCDSCSLNSNRQFNTQLFTCPCLDSFYDSGVEICQLCHYSCFTCNEFGSSSCKTCQDKSISFRVFDAGVCQCLPGYYDDGTTTYCKNCQVQCLTCQNTADYCTSCPVTRHLDGNSCKCDTGYFDNKVEKCDLCDQNCLNCIVTQKNCTECDLSLSRILDNVSHTCICKFGTTEIDGICQLCDTTCLTCKNSISYCTQCQTLRLLVNNQCQCIDGTYESGSDKKCLFCSSTCLTCINEESYCTSCSAENRRIFQTGNICICQDGYYEEATTLSCKQCDLSCLTCKVSSTYCLSCDSKYNLSLDIQNRCICSSGFFFNRTNLKCEACNFSCKECQAFSQCLECENLTRYYDPDNFKCQCKDGYYESNTKECSLCNITCKTCINQSTKCLSCESIYFRVLNNSNQCFCQDGYYDIEVEMCQLCNKLCKTCQLNSLKCFSCYEQQHFRQLNSNQCICQNGYFDNGSLICEKCSNQCLTCQGKRDFCTSCDINQKRIDQSVINKCPCLSGFFQNSNENCQRCDIKCQTCNQSRSNCISCSTSINSNRQTISKNCICKDGYYDDGTQVDCQKCNQRCKLCLNSSTNCQTCSNNLRDAPPICDCKVGFFEDENQICQPCQNQCLTCENTSSNCLSCKETRTGQQCICQDGYFEDGQTLCVQCDFQCKQCKDSSQNCLSCKGNRINQPYCACPDEFYDDLLNENCQVCDESCYTCNLDGCLICNGNRLLSPEMSCDQPPNSKAHPNTPWCSTCEVAVIEVRFSDDLLSILVQFDFPLNPKFFTSLFQDDNVCLKILEDKTYQQLGQNPICYIDPNDDTQLIIKIGYRVSIVQGDKILFQINQFGHQGCSTKLTKFIFNQVKNPINPVSPQINYDLPTYLLNPCDDNIILIKKKINDGLRGLNGIIWTYTVEGLNGNGNLENFVAQQTNLQMLELIIPFKTLPKQSNITLNIEFQNFVDQKTVQFIRLQTHSGQFPTILWVSKPQYFSFQTIFLEFQIRKRDCSESTNTQIDNSEYQVSIVEVFRNDSNSRPSRVNHSEITSQSLFNVTIRNFTLSSGVAYTFQQTTLDSLMNFSITRNVTLEISSGGIICLFNGTKKIQNYRKETILQISCKDLDVQYDWNEDNSLQTNVECVDLTMNAHCMDLNQKLLNINRTERIQIIPKQTIKPYTIQSWQVIATKKQLSYRFKLNIVYIDNEFNLLNVSYSQGYLMRSVNNYENLEFTINIPFEDRNYLLEYQVAIIYNFELIKILQSEYYFYQFRIFDYFQKFTKGKQFNLKFLAQFTTEINPSQYDLQITINQPPNCIVSFSQQSIEALKPFKIITICDYSETAPFYYQTRYFLQNQDFLEFQNRTSDYSLVLNQFQSSNIFEGYFPSSDGIILTQAMDSRGSYLNIEKQLNITKIQLKCSEINIYTQSLKQQILLLLEIMLNHQDQNYCIQLSQQLYSIIKTNMEAGNINVQTLVYQTIKLFKRLVQDQITTNTQKRLLDDSSQESCFENTTKKFYLMPSTINNIYTETPKSLLSEIKQLQVIVQKMISQKIDIVDQINQDSVFLDEKLYQKKEAVFNSLTVLLLIIDDIFVKIPKTTISSNSDKEQIVKLSEDLINLIENIADQISSQAKVNGLQLIINGQMLKWQLSKITKDHFNRQYDVNKDILDGLIDFVQQEEIDINYNYLNLSQQLQTTLQKFFNFTTTIEIEDKIYKKTNLQNHLYNSHYVNSQQTLKKYIIDMVKYQYCQKEVPQQFLYQYQCLDIYKNGSIYNCDLVNEEINNHTVQVSCQCEQLGNIFLIKYLNNSLIQQNISSTPKKEEVIYNSKLELSEQPILLFHALFISFSYFLYFELFSIEYKQQKNNKTFNRIDSDNSEENSNKNKKVKFIEIYPGNLIVFKKIFKYIHEVLSLFYTESTILTKSYLFLQLSIKISMLIPFAFLETAFINQITLYPILIINCFSFLLIRLILKVIQSIYRFGGGLSVSIVFIYMLIHLICYLQFIIQLKQFQEDFNQINFEIFVILVLSIFLFYVIVDPIMIFSRILIFRHVYHYIRNPKINPKFQFAYFFIKHQKLDELFQTFAVV